MGRVDICYKNDLGHITKIADMPIHGQNPSKIFYFQKSLKLGIGHM